MNRIILLFFVAIIVMMTTGCAHNQYGRANVNQIDLNTAIAAIISYNAVKSRGGNGWAAVTGVLIADRLLKSRKRKQQLHNVNTQCRNFNRICHH